MEDTPAAMDRETGQMYINPKRFFALTPFQREFVKLHEKGHYVLNTDSELAADEYAFKHLAGSQFRSLKQCIECLEEILDENLIGHKVRVDQMYKLALQWDKQHPVNKAINIEQNKSFDDIYNLQVSDELNPQVQIDGADLWHPYDPPTPPTPPVVNDDQKPSDGTTTNSPDTGHYVNPFYYIENEVFHKSSNEDTKDENNKIKYITIGVIVLVVLIALSKK